MKEGKGDYINYRIQKSVEVLEDAKILVENKRWNSSINRLYYSSFYLANAIIHKNGIKADTHNGVKTKFSLHFVKTGLISVESGKLYANLFDWRQESDYADYINFDESFVLDLIPKVEDLNKKILELINSHPQNPDKEK